MKTTFEIQPEQEVEGSRLIRVDDAEPLSDLLFSSFTDPARDFLSREGKRFRARLVRMGYLLSPGYSGPGSLDLCCEAVEMIHSGSLVIDDIQDESFERRGGPSLHVRYGVPIALNVGNAFYFIALETLSRLDLPAALELELHRICHRLLLTAHYGQALDLGVRIDQVEQARVPEVYDAIARWKTGSITALALAAGAITGGMQGHPLIAVEKFGDRFGRALQMFDDIGNVRSNQSPSKRQEDLATMKPTWLWSVAAQTLRPAEYSRFKSAVIELNQLKEAQDKLDILLESFGVLDSARYSAKEHLERTNDDLRRAFPDRAGAAESAASLCRELEGAYE